LDFSVPDQPLATASARHREGRRRNLNEALFLANRLIQSTAMIRLPRSNQIANRCVA
jgi:hypothetical protein